MFSLVTVVMCVLFTPPYSRHMYKTQTFLNLTINKGLKGQLQALLISCVGICAQSDNTKIAEDNNPGSTLPNETHHGYHLGNKQTCCVYVRAIRHNHFPPTGYCPGCYDNCTNQDKSFPRLIVCKLYKLSSCRT